MAVTIAMRLTVGAHLIGGYLSSSSEALEILSLFIWDGRLSDLQVEDGLHSNRV